MFTAQQDVNVGVVAPADFVTPPHDIFTCFLEVLVSPISFFGRVMRSLGHLGWGDDTNEGSRVVNKNFISVLFPGYTSHRGSVFSP
jgi:hypothetical protein